MSARKSAPTPLRLRALARLTMAQQIPAAFATPAMSAIFRKLAFSLPDPFRETATVPRRSSRGSKTGKRLARRSKSADAGSAKSSSEPRAMNQAQRGFCCDEDSRRFFPPRQAQTFSQTFQRDRRKSAQDPFKPCGRRRRGRARSRSCKMATSPKARFGKDRGDACACRQPISKNAPPPGFSSRVNVPAPIGDSNPGHPFPAIKRQRRIESATSGRKRGRFRRAPI